MKKYAILDPNDPLCQELGKKYNLPAPLIAYLRVALLRDDHKYDKDSLIQHILQENKQRTIEITRLQLNPTPEKEEQITGIKNKMQLRELAIIALQNIKNEELSDILKAA
jgi:hypothetical protein